MKTPKSDTKKLATKYGVCSKTIARWKRAGAPLHDQKRMRLWCASRKHHPAATEHGHSPCPAPVPNVPPVHGDSPPPDGLPQGASFALQRLEQAEAGAYAAYDAAVKSGDPMRQKLASRQWLDLLYELRQLDADIELSRRAEGELVERRDVLRGLQMFACCLATAAVHVATSGASSLAACVDEVGSRVRLRELLFDEWLHALTLCRSSTNPPPPAWMFDPFEKALSQRYMRIGELIAERIAVLGEVFQHATQCTLWSLDERDRNWKYYREHGNDAPLPPGEVPPWNNPPAP